MRHGDWWADVVVTVCLVKVLLEVLASLRVHDVLICVSGQRDEVTMEGAI